MKSIMTKKNILIAIATVIVFTLLTVVMYFLFAKNGMETVTSELQRFTKEELVAARLEAYNEALGERKQYEETISALQKQLVEERAAWQKKYDDMVAEKDAEIERLTEELTSNVAYMRELEKYIMDFFQISLPENSNTPRAALDLQLAAFTMIKNNLTSQKSQWEEALKNLPSESVLREEIETKRIAYDEAVRNQEIAFEPYGKYRALNNIIVSPNGEYFNDNITESQSTLSTSFIENKKQDLLRYCYENIRVLYGPGSSIPLFEFRYNSADDTYSYTRTTQDLYEYLCTQRRGYLGYSIFSDDSSNYKIFILDRLISEEEKYNDAKAIADNTKADLDKAQGALEEFIADRAIAEAMIASATSGIEQAKERITELEAKIAELEALQSQQPEQGAQEQGGTEAPDPTVTA